MSPLLLFPSYCALASVALALPGLVPRLDYLLPSWRQAGDSPRGRLTVAWVGDRVPPRPLEKSMSRRLRRYAPGERSLGGLSRPSGPFPYPDRRRWAPGLDLAAPCPDFRSLALRLSGSSEGVRRPRAAAACLSRRSAIHLVWLSSGTWPPSFLPCCFRFPARGRPPWIALRERLIQDEVVHRPCLGLPGAAGLARWCTWASACG